MQESASKPIMIPNSFFDQKKKKNKAKFSEIFGHLKQLSPKPSPKNQNSHQKLEY